MLRSRGLKTTAAAGVICLAMVTAVCAQAPAETPPTESPTTQNPSKERRRDRAPQERSDPSGGADQPNGHRNPQSPPLQLSEQQAQAVRAFVQQHLPHLWEDLELGRETNPRAYERDLAQMFPRVAKLMRDREADPATFELGVKIEDIEVVIRRKVRRYNNLAEAGQREALSVEIRGLLAERFDLEQTRGIKQLESLERRLALLRTQLENRNQQKEELLARELEDRLSSADPGSRGTPRKPPDSPH